MFGNCFLGGSQKLNVWLAAAFVSIWGIRLVCGVYRILKCVKEGVNASASMRDSDRK